MEEIVKVLLIIFSLSYLIFKEQAYVTVLLIITASIFVAIMKHRNQQIRKRNHDARDEFNSSKPPVEVPFEYTVVPGIEAVETCLKLRETPNITPLIFGGYTEVKKLFADETPQSPQSSQSTETIIKKSLQFDIKLFIKSQIEKDPEFYSDSIGEWPKQEVQKHNLIAHTNISSGRPLKEVLIGLIPMSKSYEVPAFLDYAWWDGRRTEDHVGIWRYWYEKYGAEIIHITPNTIECTVKFPPTTQEEALVLAKEQFVYCPDIVVQGTETISALAAGLIDHKYWFFWWD